MQLTAGEKQALALRIAVMQRQVEGLGRRLDAVAAELGRELPRPTGQAPVKRGDGCPWTGESCVPVR